MKNVSSRTAKYISLQHQDPDVHVRSSNVGGCAM